MTAANRTSNPPPPAVGDLLADRYRLLDILGAGGMGTVFKALDEDLEAHVAVKVLHPELTASTEFHRRFKREASILKAIVHPGVVRILEVGSEPSGRCYISMELLSGETLARTLARRGKLTPKEFAPMLLGMCDALETVHKHGVIHGDLKPLNVHVLEDGSVKVLDFGLAKVQGLERLTRTGEVHGTPAYMAPELVTGEGGLEPAVDVYALGIITYEALSGAKPFLERNPGKLLFEIVTGRVTPLQDRAGVSRALSSAVQRAIAPKVAGRFPNVRTFKEAFQDALR